MIKEAYCSFEVAKLLKEKGFDELFIHMFVKDGVKFDCSSTRVVPKETIACPTHQMAMAWLREVHNLSVETFSIKGTSNVCPVFWKSNIVKILTQDYAFSSELVYSYEEAVEAALKFCLENLI